MRRAEKNNVFWIGLSFLVGIILTIMPLPQWAIWLRPQWMFAILLFWVIASPTQCGIGTAFFVGLIMDLVTGTPVGEHALAFVVLTYVVMKVHNAITHFPIIQQAGVIGIIAAINAFLQGWILGFAGHSTHVGLYALSAITTAIIWPWLYGLLNQLRPKMVIY